MDKLETIPPSTSHQTQNSVSRKTFKLRISSLFHKNKPFEEKFSKRLDTIIPLCIEVYTNNDKYTLIKASLARNALQISDEDAYIETSGRRFIKRFETTYNRKQRSMDKLLHMIKSNEDLIKALEMIDNRFAFAEEPVQKLGIGKIKQILNKTFNLSPYNEPSGSTKKLLKSSKFVPILPAIFEQEEPTPYMTMCFTRL